MNFKQLMIALAVKVLADNTSLVRKSDPSEAFWYSMFGIESDEHRMTRNIEVEVDRAIETAKRVKVNRKFKKIVEKW